MRPPLFSFPSLPSSVNSPHTSVTARVACSSGETCASKKFQQARPNAPLLFISCPLLPGSKRDGISLRTLYRRAAGRAPTLLVVSDTSGASFGAFTNEAWKVGPRFRGTGECFVFRLAPEPRIFRWSKLNSFFMLGQPDSIAVGAGGHFALWLDEELHRGTSGDCDTFRSKCLSSAADFEIGYVELWGFV
jgi:hypothetical protein